MRGQLIFRGENTWLCRVYLGRSCDGKRKYANRTVRGSKKTGQMVLTEMLAQRDSGRLLVPSRQTVGNWLAEWLEQQRLRVAPRTFADYGIALTRHVLPALGGVRLSKLHGADVQHLVNALAERGLGAASVRLAVAPLKSAMTVAVRQGRLSTNPCQFLEMPRAKRVERHVLAPEQARDLVHVAEDDVMGGPIITLLLMTGLRPSEACALRWTDIDEQRGVLRVRRALVESTDGFVASETKTRGSVRAIELTKIERDALVRQRRVQATERLQAGPAWHDGGYIFTDRSGRPLSPLRLSGRVWPRLRKRAGLPDTVRLYDLRHSCATLLLAAGVNPKVIAERLGHSTVRLTLDTYSHVLPTQQKEASDTLAALVTTGQR